MADIAAAVRGMHCAGCVGKVERALRDVDGVEEASVNLATERARVRFDPDRTAFAALQQAVARVGYELAPPPAGPEPAAGATDEATIRDRDQQQLRTRFVVGALLSAPIMVGSMPAVFPWAPAWLHNPWLLLVLTTPVMFWVGGQFHRGFLHDLRYRSASMSTLVSIGTGAAYFFSVAVTVWPHAFMALGVMTHYETAAVVITLVVLGRWLEARARGQTSEAIQRLLSLAPAMARVIRRGDEAEIPAAEVRAGDLVRIRPGERLPVDGVVVDGTSSVDGRCSPARAFPWTKGRNHGSSAVPSTARARSSFVRPAWAVRPRSPASSSWWRQPRARGRRSSGWPTRSRPSSCPPCSSWQG